MGEVLKYRFPGQSSVSLNGSFSPLDLFSNFSGFVVSSFDKSKRYCFVEADVDQEFHFSSEKPQCYSKEEYLLKGGQFLNELKTGTPSKAILSRVTRVDFKSEPSVFFDTLCEEYPNAFVYLISSKLFGTWIAATPEVLINQSNGRATTMALAGTRKVSSGISWTEKEKVEQQFVSDFILESLKKDGATNIVVEGPNSVNAGPVEHLRTDFSFNVDELAQTKIIENLHPTPAVCGTPRSEALELINKIESHDRDLYAGIVGQIGDATSIYVNLRCAQLIENECYLYVGGGYTAQSNPTDEWAETENKAKTLLNIIEKL